MYFPYLRGKQYELLALRELSELIASSNRITPLIEPVKESFSNLNRSLEIFKKDQMPFILISNPSVGDFAFNWDSLQSELEKHRLDQNPKANIGYIVSSDTQIDDIEHFFEVYNGYNLCLVHDYNFSNYRAIVSLINKIKKYQYNFFVVSNTGYRYKRKYKGLKKVLIEDGFNKNNRRNEDFPPDEFFSDLHLYYEEEGCDGFGDFLIVGNEYSDTGGPAYAVAIHLTYLNADEEIWIKHFISDTKGTPVDPAGKFLEALEKLATYVRSDDNDIFMSDACKEFLDLYRRQHYPGLGYAKKLSMKHHIELIKHNILV